MCCVLSCSIHQSRGDQCIRAAIFGVVGVNFSNWMFTRLRTTSHADLWVWGIKLDSMFQVILGYGVLWGLIGLGLGLGIGSVANNGQVALGGSGRIRGGLLAAMIYVLLVAQLATQRDHEPCVSVGL